MQVTFCTTKSIASWDRAAPVQAEYDGSAQLGCADLQQVLNTPASSAAYVELHAGTSGGGAERMQSLKLVAHRVLDALTALAASSALTFALAVRGL